MKITSLAYSRSEDDPKHRKNPDAVRPAPSPLGLAALSVGGGGSSGSSSSGITVGTTTVTSGTSGRVLYTTSGNVVGSAPINVNALNSTYLDVASGASGAGLTLSVAGGGTDENRIDKAKGTGIIRIVPDTAGAGTVVVGASTDTADAQLSVYSQSTTRPSLKLRALSGTSGTQAALENYDAANSRNLYVTAAGTILYNTDNAVDIGASGANRPRSGFFGTQLNVGTGTVIGSNIQLTNGAAFYWSTHGTIRSSADGVFKLADNAETSFGRLQFGGTTSTFPSIKRNSAGLEIRLADDSAFAAEQSLYIRYGSGTPEGAITAPVGAIYSRTDGGAGTSFYVKESGTGNTGWVAK